MLPVRKYPNADRAFGEPPLYSCTDSYKRVLEAHLTEAVAKITRSYEVGTLLASDMGVYSISAPYRVVGSVGCWNICTYCRLVLSEGADQ